MTFTSLAQPLSSILFLTIFFFSWFQWGSWSNLVSVWISHLLVCFLIFLFISIFVAHQMTLRFWASCMGLLLFFSLSTRCIKQGCSPCKRVCKVKGCPSCFWDFFLEMFCPKAFLYVLLAWIFLLWFDHYAKFWEIFGPKFFGLPINPFNAPIAFSPHLSWGDWSHFHRAHLCR
jgi:hypothetical protein